MVEDEKPTVCNLFNFHFVVSEPAYFHMPTRQEALLLGLQLLWKQVSPQSVEQDTLSSCRAVPACGKCVLKQLVNTYTADLAGTP